MEFRRLGMWFYILLVGEKYLWGKGLGKMPAVFQHIYALLAAVISWVFSGRLICRMLLII